MIDLRRRAARLIDSGSERRAALFAVTSHQADVIGRLSGQRAARAHDDVTFQLGRGGNDRCRLGHVQVNKYTHYELVYGSRSTGTLQAARPGTFYRLICLFTYPKYIFSGVAQLTFSKFLPELMESPQLL